MHAVLPLIETSHFPAIRRKRLETLQVNLGYRCNQSCVHCHVDAGPKRTEMMSQETVADVIGFLQATKIQTLDVTGGAPELNLHFRELVIEARKLNVHVMDRCNLTVFEEPGHQDLPEFLAQHRVEVIASLPCYLEENVDRQRGRGTFHSSLRALRSLNDLGYGKESTGLTLNLVYNPQGPTLPPPQSRLEADYREHLGTEYGIVFNRLFTLANMPIKRFGSMLVSKGEFHQYMQLLRDAHQDANLEAVMCRNLISVDWQGYVYDCDFNQMLELPLKFNGKPRVRLSDLISVDLQGNTIVVRDHCYGCTAGQGSSCGGALTN